MNKSTITLSLLALGAIGLGAIGWSQPAPDVTYFFKEERMILEYTTGAEEAVVIIEAESEQSLGRIEIRSPDGEPIIKLWTAAGRSLALQGFLVETRETSLASLMESFEEGIFELNGQTTDGIEVTGRARFSHELLRAPIIVFPLDGAVGVPTDMTVSWIPDPEARGYRVVLEQDENDGLVVELPAGSHSFQVPDGVLDSGTETQVEVGVVSRHGNCTLVEVIVTTW